jgi:plastocyanin
MKKLILYLPVLVILASCASLKVENMRVNNDAYVFEPSGKTVSVTTTKTVKTGILKVEAYNQSLIQSVEYSKIFTVKPSGSDYELNAVIVHWFQPPAGFDFHTDLKVVYTIKQGDNVIYTKEIESHSVATVKEAFAGMKRAKLSLERAVKQNIEMFIVDISKVKF